MKKIPNYDYLLNRIDNYKGSYNKQNYSITIKEEN